MPTEPTKTRRPPPPPGAAGTKWLERLAGGLYHSGALRAVQSLSRFFEVQRVSGRALPRWRRVFEPKFVILCYHRVGTGGVPLHSELPPEIFDAQMRFLRQRYRVVSLESLCEELGNPGPIEQSIAITFDDGYRDVYTVAFPILQKYHIPATIFASVGSIETGQVPWYDRVFLALDVAPVGELRLELDRLRSFELSSPVTRYHAALEIIACLRALPEWRRKQCTDALERQIVLPQDELADRMITWEQVRTMYRAGIAFGSHTVTHPVVSQLTPAEMEREFRESKQILEQELASPVLDFAYPFGQLADCGATSGEVLARCGYRSAATSVWGVNAPGTNPYRLRRVQIGDQRSLALFAFWLNQLFLQVAEDSPGTESRAFTPVGPDGRDQRSSEGIVT